jgi:dipeptidyl aminopeptidase/acylaminoacyl peptidase
MKVVFFLVGLGVFFLIGIFLYTWRRFRASIYVHTTANQELIKKYPLEHQDLTFKTADGETISAWYSPVQNAKAVVILIPGFTAKNGAKPLMLPHADYLTKAGYSVLLLDLRSTGDSTGQKVFLGTKEWQDVSVAYDYLAQQPENQGKKIGFFGVSMGAATAIIAAGKTGKGDFVIASVPFARYDEQFAFEVQKTHLPMPGLLLTFLKLAARIEFGNYSQFDPAKLVTQIHKPILIMTGKNDGDIQYTQAADLFALANEPKQYWLAETQHDIYQEKPAEFRSKVLEFLTSITGSLNQ